MSCKLEPTIWPCGTGQQIACFDRCQLIIAGMSNIKEVHGKLRLYVSFLEYGRHAVVVVVARMRPRAILLAKITMRESTHGFPLSFSCMMSMGLRLAALWAARAPLIIYYSLLKNIIIIIVFLTLIMYQLIIL